QVIVDGEPLEFTDMPVRLPNGQIIVSAKPLLQALGAKLVWKAAEQSLTASNAAGKVKLVVGSPRALVGDATLEAKDMAQAPVMRSGILYISPRVALAALGASLEWSAAENSLIVETIVKDMPSPTVPANRSGLEKQP
ncbi:MAG: copper amine oxidase N-terminal domain-containing protein, partial [Armatimonadota bacterium]